MIPNRIRGSRRGKAVKLSKNLVRVYKERKCRECSVVITRMDFAKILGKFTKVKIQYESSTTSKSKQNSQIISAKPIARLKSNENGLVSPRRNAYNQHTVKEAPAPKKVNAASPRSTPNILKENNRLKKSIVKDKTSNNNNTLIKKNNIKLKHYGIVFQDPLYMQNNNEASSKITLTDLISQVNDTILPSEDWCIDFFPKKGELKDDKVYDRIAAELEDLMYNEKPSKANDKPGTIDTKVDEFPSIMDILNDNTRDNKPNDQSSCLQFKSSLESSDVEAMLLGKSNPSSDPVPPTPMDVSSPDTGNLIEDVNQLAVIQDNGIPLPDNKLSSADIKCEELENPQSPSILDEALQKGIEEHLPSNTDKTEDSEAAKLEEKPTGREMLDIETKITETEIENIETTITEAKIEDVDTKATETEIEDIQTKIAETKIEDTDTKINETAIDKFNNVTDTKFKETGSLASVEGITHLVFKKSKGGICCKTVTCPKNLKYDIEINGKSVEFMGAPKYISSLEDLQVLLQIVNESELDSLYVLH